MYHTWKWQVIIRLREDFYIVDPVAEICRVCTAEDHKCCIKLGPEANKGRHIPVFDVHQLMQLKR